MLKNKFVLGAGSLVAVTIIAGAFLSSVNAFADDSVVDEINITVPTSCSLEGTGMTSHNANIVNGTYEANIGSTTLKAFCNDSNGFAIYAIGFSNEEYGNTNLIGASSSTNIVTGTATSAGNPDTSNWAMKLATDGTATYPITLDNSFNAYHIVPSTYTKVAHRDSATDIGTNATGASLTSTYAAYISKTQNADSYNGKVKYTIVHPASETPLQPVACEAGKICYNANAGAVVGQMGKQTLNNWQLTNSFILWAPNFKRDGYGFAGWNDKFDYSGNFYGPNETIAAPADVSTNGLSLYAVWVKSAGTIQNWNGCAGLASGATTALTDSRDGNTYAVAKLADNKCWMVENLRLDDSPILSSDNTHNPSLPLTNVYDSTNPTTSSHLSPATDPTSTAWCKTTTSDCYDQSMLATNNTILFSNNIASNYDISSNVYSYGNYYNWYSATAGHGKYGIDYISGYIAPGDICFAGWHLPTGNTTGEFYALNAAIGTGSNNSVSNNLRSYPNNFVYSGSASGSSFSDRGSGGTYWSSSGYGTVYADNPGQSAYDLVFSDTYAYPGTSGGLKNGGFTVRCIAGT